MRPTTPGDAAGVVVFARALLALTMLHPFVPCGGNANPPTSRENPDEQRPQDCIWSLALRLLGVDLAWKDGSDGKPANETRGRPAQADGRGGLEI